MCRLPVVARDELRDEGEVIGLVGIPCLNQPNTRHAVEHRR